MPTHIRFNEEGQPLQHAAHASSAPVFSSSQSFQCVSSVRVDFNKDATYVFQLAHSPGTGLVAAALSNKRIKLFNFRCGAGTAATPRHRPPARRLRLPPLCRRCLLPLWFAVASPWHPSSFLCCSEGGLQFVGELTGHEGMVRELRFCLPDQPHLLHSAGGDGTVRGWDTRAGQQVERWGDLQSTQGGKGAAHIATARAVQRCPTHRCNLSACPTLHPLAATPCRGWSCSPAPPMACWWWPAAATRSCFGTDARRRAAAASAHHPSNTRPAAPLTKFHAPRSGPLHGAAPAFHVLRLILSSAAATHHVLGRYPRPGRDAGGLPPLPPLHPGVRLRRRTHRCV